MKYLVILIGLLTGCATATQIKVDATHAALKECQKRESALIKKECIEFKAQGIIGQHVHTLICNKERADYFDAVMENKYGKREIKLPKD